MELIASLQGLFDEQELAWALAALRRNPRVWDVLANDKALLKAAIKKTGSDLESWTPHNILALTANADQTALKKSSPAPEGQDSDDQKLASALQYSDLLKRGIQPEMVLLSHESELPLDLALHAVFSHPMRPEKRVACLANAMQPLPDEQQAHIIQAIRPFSPAIAKAIAKAVLAQTPNEDPTNLDNGLHRATLLKLAGEHRLALEVLTTTWQISAHKQAEIAAEIALETNDEDTAQDAVEQAEKVAHALREEQPRILEARLKTGSLDPAHLTETPEEKLTRAKHLAQKFISGESELPIQEVNEIGRTLVSENEIVLAAEALEKGLSKDPGNANTLMLASQAFARQDKSKSLDYAQLATTLEPNESRLRNSYKDLLIEHGEWRAGLDQINKLIAHDESPPRALWLEKGACALLAGSCDEAIHAAKALLALDASDAKAMTMMSEALLLQGDAESAALYATDAVAGAPRSASAWSARFKTLVQLGQINEAEEAVQNGIDRVDDPTDKARLLTIFGQHLLTQNAHEQAATYLGKAHALVGDDIAATHSLGLMPPLSQALIQTGEARKAISFLQPIIAAFPGSTTLTTNLGEAFLAAGDIHEAVDTFHAAVTQSPTSAELRLSLGKALLQCERREQEAIEQFTLAQELDLDNPIPVIYIAEAQLKAGDGHKALALFQSAGAASLKGMPEWQQRVQKGMARAALAINQPQAAITALEQPKAAEPPDMETRMILCEAYFKSDLGDNAREQLKSIYNNAGESPDTLLWIARLASQLEQPELAKTSLEKCLPAELTYTQRLALGDLLFTNAQAQQAGQALNMILFDESAPPHILHGAANLWIANGEPGHALPYLNKAAERTGWNAPEILGDLSDAYFSNGDFQNSLAIIEKQLALSPESEQLLHSKARLHIQLGDLPAAKDTLEKALSLDSGNMDVQYETANLLWVMGEPERALTLAEQALEQNSADERCAYLAAELNLMALNTERVKHIIGAQSAPPKKLSWIFLQAEFALAAAQPKDYKGSLAILENIAGEHPRTLALLARLAITDGDRKKAENHYGKAVQAMHVFNKANMPPHETAHIEMAVAQAAASLADWEDALSFAKSAVGRADQDRYAQHILALILIQRAEHAHLAQDLGIETLEYQAALDKSVWEQAHDLLDLSKPEGQYWAQRLEWVFDPLDIAGFNAFKDSKQAAAWVAAMRRKNQFARCPERVKGYLGDGDVALQLALGWLATEPVKSLKLAEKALKADPMHAYWQTLLARAALADQQWLLAQQHIEQALSIGPEVRQWRLWAAQAARACGALDDAITHLETALEQEGDDAELLEQLADARMDANQSEQAAFALRKAADLRPQNPQLWKKLADANLTMGFIHEAEQAALQFAKTAPMSIEPLELQVHIAMQAGNTAKASELLDKAEEAGKLTPELMAVQSRLERQRGDRAKAMQIIDRAIQNADNPLPMLLERAEIVGEVDGPNARLSTLTALSKQFPRQADVLAHLAKSLQDSGRDADAIKAGHSALKADDGQLSPQQRAELHYDIGQLLAKQGQLDQAVHQFSLAIQTNVHATNAYIALGKTHAQRRELTPALQAFERAIDLDADNVQPYCEAAKVLKDARNYAKAEQMLRRAKQLQPDNLEINRLLSAMMTMNLVHSAEIPA